MSRLKKSATSLRRMPLIIRLASRVKIDYLLIFFYALFSRESVSLVRGAKFV